MILLGYHSTRAYKLYDSISKKVQISRDVIIYENEAWKWEMMSKTASVRFCRSSKKRVSFQQGVV